MDHQKRSAKSYDRLGSAYDAFTKLADNSLINKMRLKLIWENARGSVLEVGVGTGKNLAYYPFDTEITGIDLSNKSLIVAKEKANLLGKPFYYVNAAAECLPFEDNSFDTVVMTLVSCNLAEPLMAYNEMARVCKPDGKVLFLEHSVPESWGMKAIFVASFPIARLCLNCNPFSRNIEQIANSQLVEIDKEIVAGGALQAIVTVPNK